MTFTSDDEFGANLEFAKLQSSEDTQEWFNGYLFVYFLENERLSERYCSVLQSNKLATDPPSFKIWFQ